MATPNEEEQEKKVLDTLRKVHINIPLVDSIKQVPRYAKFLKELYINKRKLKGNQVIHVRENCFALLQKKIPLSSRT